MEDILSVVSLDKKTFNKETAILRSPLRQDFPIEKRKNSRLYIYTGIHDGYKGSVPITHSLNMYNRLVGELKYGSSDMKEIMEKSLSDSDLISPEEMLGLLGKRMNPEYEKTFSVSSDGQGRISVFRPGGRPRQDKVPAFSSLRERTRC